LLETTFTLGVHVAFSTEEGKKDGEEYERVRCCPEDEGDPDAEVVDFEDLDSESVKSIYWETLRW
jgi:hypothetical protein